MKNEVLDEEKTQEDLKQESLHEQNYKDEKTLIIWKSIGFGVLGLFAGLLVYRSSEKDGAANIWYFFVIFGFFLILGIILGIVKGIKLKKKYKK